MVDNLIQGARSGQAGLVGSIIGGPGDLGLVDHVEANVHRNVKEYRTAAPGESCPGGMSYVIRQPVGLPGSSRPGRD